MKKLVTTPHGRATSTTISEIRLLVFDLDGTLIDSAADLCQSVNATLLHLGRTPINPRTIVSFIGNGAASLVQRSLEHGLESDGLFPAASPAMVEQALEYFLAYYDVHNLDTTKPYPGVMDSLRSLRERHPRLPMAVLTNKPADPSREICAALGLTPYFFAIYGGDSFPKKPDSEGLRALMAEASTLQDGFLPNQAVTPDTVVMIGDSAVDIQTARNCGARSLGCRYGLARDALEAASPDLLVSHPGEWLRVLDL